jgi:Ala-tRNA(Pro) deacylase
MALLEKLRAFLEARGAEYTHTEHPLAFTAREVAAVEHLPAREIAKTVVLWGDNSFHIAVLPANRLVDFQEVRLALGLSHARLATEQELAQLFPDCELGAQPPFGSLYNLPVYMDASLLAEPSIAFNGGTHRDVVHMRTPEFQKLAEPTIVAMAREAVFRHTA